MPTPPAQNELDQEAQAALAKTKLDVQLLNGWFTQSYVQPPRMDRHDAGFYVNPQGDQRFWINFCPAPTPLSEPAL